MRISVEIDTHDRQLPFDMLGQKTLGPGVGAEIPGNATITLGEMLVRKSVGIPETLEFALTFGGGVASGLVANWLYEKLRGRAAVLRIDRQVVEIDQGAITRVLTERIERRG